MLHVVRDASVLHG